MQGKQSGTLRAGKKTDHHACVCMRIFCICLEDPSNEKAALLSSTPISTCQHTGLSQLLTEKWMSFKCQSHSSGTCCLSHVSGC